MPKPIEGLHGNGMHMDMSLFKGKIKSDTLTEMLIFLAPRVID